MRSYHRLPLLLAILLSPLGIAITLTLCTSTQTLASNNSESDKIVGTWYVNTNGAPFVPHIMAFHRDHTLMINNPDAGDPRTSDSLGVGPWEKKTNNTIKGKFVEVNADRITHLFVNNLVVTFEVTVNENTFTGPAEARYYDAHWNLLEGPFPAIFEGKRITLTSLP